MKNGIVRLATALAVAGIFTSSAFAGYTISITFPKTGNTPPLYSGDSCTVTGTITWIDGTDTDANSVSLKFDSSSQTKNASGGITKTGPGAATFSIAITVPDATSPQNGTLKATVYDAMATKSSSDTENPSIQRRP